MTDCNFCGNPFASNEFGHKACIDEYGRRHDKGLCIACGLEKAVSKSDWCKSCTDSGNTSVRNYPYGAT